MKKIDKIFQYIKNQQLSEAEFERKAGISNGYLSNTSKRGADISQKILDKALENLDENFRNLFIDQGTIAAVIAATGKDEQILEEPSPYSARTSLERTLENLSEDKLKSTAIIERLVSLLEKQLGENTGPFLVPPGTPGTIPINKKQEKTSR